MAYFETTADLAKIIAQSPAWPGLNSENTVPRRSLFQFDGIMTPGGSSSRLVWLSGHCFSMRLAATDKAWSEAVSQDSRLISRYLLFVRSAAANEFSMASAAFCAAA